MSARFPGYRVARSGATLALMATALWAAVGCDSNPNGPAAPSRPSSSSQTAENSKSIKVKDLLKGKPQVAPKSKRRGPRKTFVKAGKSNPTAHGLE